MSKLQYQNRKFVIAGIAIGIVLIFILRLFALQVMTDRYKKNADSNAFLKRTMYPSRGAIYDRNGTLLVFNEPSYDITILPREVRDLDTLDLCRTLSISKDNFEERMERMKNRRLNPGYSRYTHQVFMTQLTVEESGVFQEKLFRFPGFYVNRRSIRKYSYPYAAHALGDIGEVSMRDIKNDDYYARGDYIGRQGVERSYEKYLRGEKGVEVLLRDAHGRIQGRYKGGVYDEKPSPGKDLTLSIDIELQQLGEKLMRGKLGSIVAIEPSTGEILCLVSSPTFDPSDMVGRKRGETYRNLQQDPAKPLFNRALMAAYPPASTFKIAQGAVFIQEGIVDLETRFPCYHGFVVPGLRVGCHGHASPIPFKGAISTSCNSYFCWGLYKMIDNKKYGSPTEALTVWKDHMVAMGFGYALGVDLPGEKRGLIPNAQFYDKIYGKGRWNGLRIIHTAIGQGEILLTPIQLANLGAIVANRGHFYTPHVVRAIKDTALDQEYLVPKHTSIDPKYFDYIAEGMRGAVIGSAYGGTARRVNIPDVEVCGKTGTAQNNKGRDHSVFVGFAPYKDPKIVIAVYVEHGGFGGTIAAPIARLLFQKYLKGEVPAEDQYLIDQLVNTNLIPYEFKK